MKNSSRLFAALIALSQLIHGQTAFAYLDDYTPLIREDRQRVVRLDTVKDTGLKDGKAVEIASARMSLPAEGNDITFTGKDKNGKPWKLIKQYYGLGTAFFTRDLDCNGTKDIIIIQATGGCGIAPSAVLTFLLFDGNGRPFPMEVSGYFNADEAAWSASKPIATIDDIITIGNDERAVVVCNQLDSAETKGRSHSYFRTILYRAINGRWQRLQNYQDKPVPMIVRYTHRPNQKVIQNPLMVLRSFDDCTFGATEEKACKKGVISKLQLEENGSVKALYITPDFRCEPNRWSFFETFVFRDDRDGFEVCALDSEPAKNWLRSAIDKKQEIRFAPSSNPGSLPLFFWL